MTDYEKICDFGALYKAHTVARRSKRTTREVIDFEMNLAENLTGISDELKNGTYEMSGYYSFMVHDPKDRVSVSIRFIGTLTECRKRVQTRRTEPVAVLSTARRGSF